jgi:glycine cleavage system regulatory protein
VGDQFAGILEAFVAGGSRDAFLGEIPAIEQQTGLSVTVREAVPVQEEGQMFNLSCLGQDRPGIVKALTDILLSVGANVETLETERRSAPMSGEQMFEARFRVRLPKGVDPVDVEDRLAGIGDEMMLDVQLDR